MVDGVHHIGIIVRDLEKAERFYRDVLSAVPLFRKKALSKEVGEGIGIPGAQSSISMMRLGESTLELVEYINPNLKEDIGSVTPASIGTSHCALKVQDIGMIIEKLEKFGIHTFSSPIEITEGEKKGIKWAYFRDPDGTVFELIEES